MMTQHEINLIERQLFLLERIARILESLDARTDKDTETRKTGKENGQ